MGEISKNGVSMRYSAGKYIYQWAKEQPARLDRVRAGRDQGGFLILLIKDMVSNLVNVY